MGIEYEVQKCIYTTTINEIYAQYLSYTHTYCECHIGVLSLGSLLTSQTLSQSKRWLISRL